MCTVVNCPTETRAPLIILLRLLLLLLLLIIVGCHLGGICGKLRIQVRR